MEPLAVPLLDQPIHKASRVIGYALIGLVVFCWIAQSEVAQLVETSQAYDKPYLITYFNHSLSVFMIPAQAAVAAALRWHDAPVRQALRVQHLGWRLVVLAVMYQAADWVWYLGLRGTSVADGTIIFNTMSAFVFLLEWCSGSRSLRLRTAGAVCLSLLGVAIVQRRPGEDFAAGGSFGCFGQSGGNLLVLLAAFLYACYQVKFDQATKSLGIASTNVVVGLQGLASMLFLLPGIALVARAPGCAREVFVAPAADQMLSMLCCGLLAFLFNVAFCLAVVVASPLVTSVGCMLTVPASLGTDWFLHGDSVSPSAVLGGALVVVGFLVLVLEDADASRAKAG
mmetsp:Transcript_10930/g.27531  ORF Transcript_10930/g.27531 Transcript_10930/m.27531 type:complete len:340 (-) Transcript_10930:356-1375(-)